MKGRSKNQILVTYFTKVSLEEHRDPVGQRAHDRQIMGNEQHRDSSIAFQRFEQSKNTGLHRDIERRKYLVAKQQIGPRYERPGESDALTLATGELVRIADRVTLRYSNLAEHSGNPGTNLRTGNGKKLDYGSGKGIPHPRPWIKGSIGILEDVLDAALQVRRALFDSSGQNIVTKT